MPTYRLFHVTADNRIPSPSQTWEGADDPSARAHALSIMGEHSAVEIWEGARLVARVHRQERASGAAA